MTRYSLANSSQTTAVAACVLAAVVACAGGCRSAAHDDLYTDKLAAEVRFLEDQLYQVDYENKVLRQKVDRLRLSQSKAKTPRRDSLFGSSSRKDTDSDTGTDKDSSNERDELAPPSIETPEIDLPDMGPPQVELGQPNIDSPDISPPSISLPDVDSGSILPPSESELSPPEIDPGHILPPGDARSTPDLEPSRVIIPASYNEAFNDTDTDTQTITEPAGEIEKIVIDTVYTRGHDFDTLSNQQGIYLVVKGLDADGREVPVEASMQVAIIDPRRKGSESRLGRWEYDIDQVREAWRETAATDGVHLEIPWRDRPPLGDVVTVYCRVELESGERIKADADIDLSQHRSKVELWTPRGN